MVDPNIQKKIFDSEIKTLKISNKELEDVLKILKSLKDAGVMIKGVTNIIENESKQQKI